VGGLPLSSAASAPELRMGHAPLPRHRPAPVPEREGLRNLGQVGDVPADQQLPPGARGAPEFLSAPLVQMMVPGLRAAGGWVSASTWRATANLGIALVLGGLFAFAAVWALLLVAATVWILGVGTTVRAGTLWLAVQMARLDRRRIQWLSGVGIDPPTLPRVEPGAGFRARQRAWARSPWLWRLLAYQLARLPVAGALVFGRSCGGGR
jgi:hypothetical protein